MSEKQVFSITIRGKNDCVCMTAEQSLIVALKYGKECEMYNMTERHNLKPEHLHKLERSQYHPTEDDCWSWAGPLPPAPYVKGKGPGVWGGGAHVVWEFDDLMAGV